MKPFYTNVNYGKNKLYYRGLDENGERVFKSVKFEPTIYYESDVETGFKSLDGKHVAPREYDSISSARKTINEFKDVEGFKAYGQLNYINQYIRDLHPDPIDFDPSKICIATVDIETECENGFPNIEHAQEEITCLTLYESMTKTFWVFSNQKRDNLNLSYFEEYVNHDENVVAVECEDERSMMREFLKKWCVDLKYPDVVTGWYNNTFDMPYLVNRLYNIFSKNYVDKKLSPWGKIEFAEITGMYGRTDKVVRIGGVSVLDYLELYKKFNMTKQEKYTLDHIAFVELGEAKLSYEEYDNMHTFYLEDYPRFVEYNLKDVWLINRLEDKLKLMEFALTVAYMAKVNYCDVFFPVRMIESLCYDHLLSKNIIMDAKNKDQYEKAPYVGAYVKEPHLGLHNWVVSFDLNSLYPSIIRQLNLSPETLRPQYFNGGVNVDSMLAGKPDLSYLKDAGVAVACNGHHFDTSKIGFLPEIIKRLVDGRRTVKNEMLEAEQKKEFAKGADKKKLEYEISFKHLKQLALKILANSIYGAMGNQYFAFYDTRLASAITTHGQFVIQLIERELNRFMNVVNKTEDVDYVIYMDTDSVYISFETVVEKYVERTGETDNNKIVDYVNAICSKKVEPWIEKVYTKMAKETNAYEPHMVMKREVIASRGLWKAKKMYALNVYDSEHVRYAEPKLKIMGLETQRSSTPQWCRDKLKDAIKLVLTSEEHEVQEYVSVCNKDYKNLDVGDIAFPRSVNNMEKWIEKNAPKSGCPIGVKSSHYFNVMVKTKSLENKYQKIKSGDKIKFMYLREPNPSHIPVIAFSNSLPKEFELHSYIDYEMMFEKSFLTPLQNILEPIGWKAVKQNTLEEIFDWS